MIHHASTVIFKPFARIIHFRRSHFHESHESGDNNSMTSSRSHQYDELKEIPGKRISLRLHALLRFLIPSPPHQHHHRDDSTTSVPDEERVTPRESKETGRHHLDIHPFPHLFYRPHTPNTHSHSFNSMAIDISRVRPVSPAAAQGDIELK